MKLGNYCFHSHLKLHHYERGFVARYHTTLRLTWACPSCLLALQRERNKVLYSLCMHSRMSRSTAQRRSDLGDTTIHNYLSMPRYVSKFTTVRKYWHSSEGRGADRSRLGRAASPNGRESEPS